MNVLIACEFSGIVRDAFIKEGHNAISCDLLETERPGPHIQGDVKWLLRYRWDLIIAHPPCTYLANSGSRWLYEEEGRFDKVGKAADFFRIFLEAKAPLVAVENPVMHKHGRKAIGGMRPDFTIQPWQFGHGECKRTCFWTKNLPPLKPTRIVSGRKQKIFSELPSPDRWKKRSRFYPGIARAMARQWGSL